MLAESLIDEPIGIIGALDTLAETLLMASGYCYVDGIIRWRYKGCMKTEALLTHTISGDLALRLSKTMEKPFHGRDSWDLRKAESVGMLYEDVLDQAITEAASPLATLVAERYVAIYCARTGAKF